MAYIDDSVVKALIETQLQTVNSSIIPAANVYFQHMAVPGGNGGADEPELFIKLVSIDLMRTPGHRDGAAQDQVKYADVVVTVHCQVSGNKAATNPGAISSVMSEVGRVLFEAQLIQSSGAGPHVVDILKVDARQDGEVDRGGGGNRRIQSGAVIASGKVIRTSGKTIADYT